ncbi:hypothetical protein PGRAN_13953 [Listeria grandensis FSL F6-0971]|uniref:Uncharacterized protein n=1 Tax=Listeria grandensis FSL F6-0971 TaxID=1265819 RepID=W7B366_9LIST|nr:hypothetical protein [Listeria grandensis]EUJ21704.1 hypothetical protein PGRAN_13953 [Listeria grandensis FSL F6-0971]
MGTDFQTASPAETPVLMLMNYALLENDFPIQIVKDKLEEEKEHAKRFQNSEDQKILMNKNRNVD